MHCWPLLAQLLEETELLDTRELLLELLEETSELDETELTEETLASDELEDELLAVLELAPEQTLPVTVGVSIAPPLASTCTPKETVCPGWILAFQPRSLAA